MRDPVSEELAQRQSEPLPWRWAFGVSLGLHGAVALLLTVFPTFHRALSIPSVRVRLAPVSLPPSSAGEGPSAAAPSPKLQAPATTSPMPKVAPTRAVKAPQPPTPKKTKASPRSQLAGTPVPQREGAAARQPGSAPGGLGLGVSTSPGESTPFPYDYYLQRVLAGIEENWFRPPAPAGTRCRVRCRIGRSGQLLEAELEEPSGHSAYDRAALRAVYASAPFPPLPQGFGGHELILHLDFSQ